MAARERDGTKISIDSINESRSAFVLHIDAQVGQAVEQLQQRCAARKQALRETAERLKQDYSDKVDVQLIQQVADVGQAATTMLSRLHAAAHEHRAWAEARATALKAAYERNRKLDEVADREYRFQKRAYE